MRIPRGEINRSRMEDTRRGNKVVYDQSTCQNKRHVHRILATCFHLKTLTSAKHRSNDTTKFQNSIFLNISPGVYFTFSIQDNSKQWHLKEIKLLHVSTIVSERWKHAQSRWTVYMTSSDIHDHQTRKPSSPRCTYQQMGRVSRGRWSSGGGGHDTRPPGRKCAGSVDLPTG